MKLNLREYATKHNVPIISPATEEFLSNHIAQHQPKLVLEVGTAIGYSTNLIAQHISSRRGIVYTFEISHPSYQVAMLYKRQYQQYNIKAYRHNFLDIELNKLLTSKIDFVFIDGRKSEYYKYVGAILPYCSEHATIVCDDVISYSDKTKSLINYLQTQDIKYQIVGLDDQDGVLVIDLAKQ